VAERQALQRSLLDWAAEEVWDWFVALPIPKYRGRRKAEVYFEPWVRAIERHDGTSAFRFMRFTRIGQMPPVNGHVELFVLVGGLGSGEWRYWLLRWAAMNSDTELRGRKLWSARGDKPLGPVLRKACGKGEFCIEMRHRPRHFEDERRLKVDDKGMPYEPKLREALKQGLRAAETRALEPGKGIVVTPNGTRYRSLID
jgi:hypothetical protein